MNCRLPTPIAICPVRLGSCPLRCGEEYHASIDRSGPLSPLPQRCDPVAFGAEADMRGHHKSVAPDPWRHFGNADYRIAKGSIRGTQNMEHPSDRLPGSLRLDARGL